MYNETPNKESIVEKDICMKEIVNILTPVYNGEHQIFRLLDSILVQTYPNITMYVIDDGSTDNTKSVIDQYIPLFEKKGYVLHYMHQENKGLSATINRGLKYVNGDYLLWPDADDWYKTPDAIETMVQTIRQTDDKVGVVRCHLEFVDENTMSVISKPEFSPCNKPCDLLSEAIYEKNNFLYAPIEWIIKIKFLDSFIPGREIAVYRLNGQNSQILWPYLSHTKCVTIDRILGCYLVRASSHSHNIKDYNHRTQYFEQQLATNIQVLQGLDNLSKDKKDEFIRARRIYYYREFYKLDYEYNNTSSFRKHYRESILYKLPIRQRQRRLWYWTFILNISSYKAASSFLQRVKKKLLRKA